MITIENDDLRVSIRSQGAELTSIFNKKTGIEHLWQADPTVWGWHAPNLFPVVGGCQDNQLLIEGKAYPMQRHGFARQSEFTLIESSPTTATLSLKSSEATQAVYPYTFDFQLLYSLDNAVLTIVYRVVNQSDETMYFSVGAHPAFAVPFLSGEKFEDYFLEFQKEESLDRHLLSPNGLFNGQTEPVLLVSNQLPLTNELFEQDALVFKQLDSRSVSIRSRNHDHAVVVSFPPFPYLGIWAKPGAAFVCIEPWLGYADSEGIPLPIEQKEAIQHIAANGQFETGFTIGIL